MHFVVEKDEATNDENDGGLGGTTCRQKKDKNANKEGPSKKKPKVCFGLCVYIHITYHLVLIYV